MGRILANVSGECAEGSQHPPPPPERRVLGEQGLEGFTIDEILKMEHLQKLGYRFGLHGPALDEVMLFLVRKGKERNAWGALGLQIEDIALHRHVWGMAMGHFPIDRLRYRCGLCVAFSRFLGEDVATGLAMRPRPPGVEDCARSTS